MTKNTTVSIIKSFIASATLAGDEKTTNLNRQANASAWARKVWAEYEETATAASIFADFIESGFLPEGTKTRIHEYKFKMVLEFSADETFAANTVVPEKLTVGKKGSVWLEAALKAGLVHKSGDANVVYAALSNTNPRKKNRTPTMAGTKSSKTEIKNLSSPVAPVLTVATGNDWHGIAKSFMDTKPTMAQRRAILMDLQSVFGCDIEETV